MQKLRWAKMESDWYDSEDSIDEMWFDKIYDKFTSFMKYAGVGLLLFFASYIILKLGTEMGYDLFWLNTVNFVLGFVAKYVLYDKLKVFQ